MSIQTLNWAETGIFFSLDEMPHYSIVYCLDCPTINILWCYLLLYFPDLGFRDFLQTECSYFTDCPRPKRPKTVAVRFTKNNMREPLPSPTSHLHRRQEIFPPNQKNVTWYRERDIGTWHWYVTFVRDVEQSHRTVSFKSYEMKIPTCPLSLTATFSTAPPCSYVIGGVSLHPPERSIRAEIKHLMI